MSKRSRQEEVERNFGIFMEQLPDLLRTHPAQFAIIHNEEIIEFCDTFRDAVVLAKALFPNSYFSVQEITAPNLAR
jgi:hypothetical protein